MHRRGIVGIRIVTFNAGLATGFLPNVTERAPHVYRALAALAALDVDLLAVQEVWLERQWEELRAATRASLPHALRPAPLIGAAPGGCTERELAPFVACAKAHCAGRRDEDLARCVLRHCTAAAFTLSAPCLNALASHPHGTLEEIIARCLRSDEQPSRASYESRASRAESAPASRDTLMAYGGSFGTGLLSRGRIVAESFHAFASTINARGVQHARVALAAPLGDTRELDVFATHLSPGGPEHPVQVQDLVDFIARTAPHGPAVLLGDLNTSPGSDAFRTLGRAGFAAPAASDPRGTYASDGLASGRVTDGGWRLDHVLLRAIDAPARTTRILDDVVELDLPGGRARSTLSDHFGVLATIG